MMVTFSQSLLRTVLLCTSAPLCFFSSQVIAGPFDGVYSSEPAQCASEYDPYRVTVTDRELRFAEDRCQLNAPTAATSPSGAMIYQAQCQGLDFTWSGRIVLIPTGNGNLAIIEGEDDQAIVYRRCS